MGDTPQRLLQLRVRAHDGLETRHSCRRQTDRIHQGTEGYKNVGKGSKCEREQRGNEGGRISSTTVAGEFSLYFIFMFHRVLHALSSMSEK